MPLTIITETFIPGYAKTKGSLEFVTRSHARESVAGSKRWRMMMADAVRRDMAARNRTPLYGAAVGVRLHFVLAGAPRGTVVAIDRAPIWIRSGDVDKLARNVLDALTDAGAYADDVQVAQLMVSKVSCVDNRPGLYLSVWELTPSQIGLMRAIGVTGVQQS